MSTEDRLRRAIEARTSSIEPSTAGLDRITEKLLDQGDPMNLSSRRPRLFLAAAAAVVLVGLVGGVVLATRDDHNDGVDTIDRPEGSSTETTTSTTATTTAPVAPNPDPVVPPTDIQDLAVWPRPSSQVRFDDPVAAASSFARYLVRFENPVVGEFRPGDARSGEVPLRPRADGPETTALVRQLSDDKWYVIGATTADIIVTQPQSGAPLACPLVPTGAALAFEGHVQVHIDGYQADGDRVTLGDGFVMGMGSPPPGPIYGSVDCSIPAAGDDIESSGVVVFFTTGGETDMVWEATVVPVRLR